MHWQSQATRCARPPSPPSGRWPTGPGGSPSPSPRLPPWPKRHTLKVQTATISFILLLSPQQGRSLPGQAAQMPALTTYSAKDMLSWWSKSLHLIEYQSTGPERQMCNCKILKWDCVWLLPQVPLKEQRDPSEDDHPKVWNHVFDKFSFLSQLTWSRFIEQKDIFKSFGNFS